MSDCFINDDISIVKHWCYVVGCMFLLDFYCIIIWDQKINKIVSTTGSALIKFST